MIRKLHCCYCISGERSDFWAKVNFFTQGLIESEKAAHIVATKGMVRGMVWWAAVERRCEEELALMKINFADPKYHQARSNFVHKRKACASYINISSSGKEEMKSSI